MEAVESLARGNGRDVWVQRDELGEQGGSAVVKPTDKQAVRAAVRGARGQQGAVHERGTGVPMNRRKEEARGE